jgi:pimeloyl-ACP methyl ester carboxylesterase
MTSRQQRAHHERWRGRHPALRWRLQTIANRARGELDAYDVPHSHFWVTTSDGVRLAGTRLGAGTGPGVVLVHGFMGYRTKKPWRRLAQGLAERFTVYAFDLRGHGQSEGLCSGGELEKHDVHSVVRYVRERHDRVVTVGGSLGGIAVVREAAEFRDIDAVVAISTPAVWIREEGSSKAVARAQRIFTTSLGRALARRLMGTRIALDWGDPAPPAEVVAHIAPIPLLIVHGENDHFFPASDARLLYERAHEPKQLVLLPGFGHAEDGFTDEFAARLCDDIDALLARAPTP